MRIRLGCRLSYSLPQPTPMIALLNVHFSRFGELDRPDYLVTTPSVPIDSYRDGFGNWCSPTRRARRIVHARDRRHLPRQRRTATRSHPDAAQHAVEDLPHEALSCLLGSRYCDTDRLSETGLAAFRSDAARVGARPGDLRLRPRPRDLRIRTRPRNPHRRGDLRRTRRRLPRLHPPRHRLLPLHEHPGPLLHRLPQRHRRAAAAPAWRLRRLDGGLPWRPVARIRSAQQYARASVAS